METLTRIVLAAVAAGGIVTLGSGALAAPSAAPVSSPAASARPLAAVGASGRGWTAKVVAPGGVSERGNHDALLLELPGNAKADCRVFVQAPVSLTSELYAVVSNDRQASLSVEHVGAAQGRPILGLELGVRDPETTSGALKKTLVAVLADAEHPVVCTHPGQRPDRAFWSATRRLFDTITWEKPATPSLFSEVHRKFTRGVVQKVPRSFGFMEYAYTERPLGFDWAFATAGPNPGETSVTTRSLAFPLGFLLANAVETTNVESVDAAKNLVRFEQRKLVDGTAETTLVLHVDRSGTCRYERKGPSGAKSGRFACPRGLSSTLGRDERLAASAGSATAFDFSLDEYIPELASERATPVRYARAANDPPRVVRATTGKFELALALGADGRFDETELTAPWGKASTRRVFSSIPSRKRAELPPPPDPRPKGKKTSNPKALVGHYDGSVGGSVSSNVRLRNVRQTFAKSDAGVTACYLSAVAEDDSVKGFAAFSLRLHEDGSVQSVKGHSFSGSYVPRELIECTKNVLMRLKFDPPENYKPDATVSAGAAFGPSSVRPGKPKFPRIEDSRAAGPKVRPKRVVL